MSYTEKDYKAVRRGEIYCAPFCGHNCTYAEYLAAQARADVALSELGPGWKARIWEGFGWHASVIDSSGHIRINIYAYGSGSRYTAFFSLDPTAPGCVGAWVSAHRKTASDAAKAVLNRAHDRLREIQDAVRAYAAASESLSSPSRKARKAHKATRRVRGSRDKAARPSPRRQSSAK